MSDKLPDDKDGLLEMLKKLWLPVAGFIGSVTLLYNAYQMWLGDQATVTFITAGTGLIILVVLFSWVGFSYKTVTRDAVWPIGEKKTEKSWRYSDMSRKVAWASLGIILMGAAINSWLFVKHQEELRDKVVLVITRFDGPENDYGIRNEILEGLMAITTYDDIEIISADEIVTSEQGSEYARKVGEKYRADILIWAWYRPTENPNITIHVENMSPVDFSTIEESRVYAPTSTLVDLESFSLQKLLSAETKSLVLFLNGYVRMKARDCHTALSAFALILSNDQLPLLIERKEVLFLSGVCHSFLHQYDQAILDLDQAIEIDPRFLKALNARARIQMDRGDHQVALEYLDEAIEIDPNYAGFYINRASVYNELSFNVEPGYREFFLLFALEDLDTAIQIEPTQEMAYNNRGGVYMNLGQYERAIEDFNKAIQIEPNYANPYNNRGTAYVNLGKYQRARNDFNKAISLSPKYVIAYVNRSGLYIELGQYRRAILDIEKLIQLNPENGAHYFKRGLSYYQLKQYERSIEDFDKVVQMNPEYPDTYLLRGSAHQILGQTTEAEADFKKYEELTGERP